MLFVAEHNNAADLLEDVAVRQVLLESCQSLVSICITDNEPLEREFSLLALVAATKLRELLRFYGKLLGKELIAGREYRHFLVEGVDLDRRLWLCVRGPLIYVLVALFNRSFALRPLFLLKVAALFAL